MKCVAIVGDERCRYRAKIGPYCGMHDPVARERKRKRMLARNMVVESDKVERILERMDALKAVGRAAIQYREGGDIEDLDAAIEKWRELG